MPGDKDLNDDLIKRVRYWAVFTEQGLEATFPDSFCTITGRKDESRFISWKTSEFYLKIGSMSLAVPEEWIAGLPDGVTATPDMSRITAIGNPANEYLLIDFEVVSRYQKEDLKLDARQVKFYENGSTYFDLEVKKLRARPQPQPPAATAPADGAATPPSGCSPAAHRLGVTPQS